ncbi:MAG: hypothetical protein NZM42_05875 [Gemmatales bacterium]|nr:hypothetical protein [Gemmatales bacterium]
MPYFEGKLVGVPHYVHCEWDACDVGWRMVEAYILARQILGQRDPAPPECNLRTFVFGTVREDGLSYRPNRPWCKPHAWMWDHGRALIALATWLRFEPSDEVERIAQRMVDGLARIALKEKEYWHYPAENWTGEGWGDVVYGHPPTGLAIEGLVDLAALLRNDRCLDMARHFVQAIRLRKPPMFLEDGTLVRKGGGPYHFDFTHLHARLSIMHGIIKYGLVTGDHDLIEWGSRAYHYVRDHLCSSFGWVPESLESGPDRGRKGRDEGCCISDMIQIAATLAQNGWPQERALIGMYGVNHLWAHQLIDFKPLRHLIGDASDMVDTIQCSYKKMPDRMLGCFTGCMHPNDLVLDSSPEGAPQYIGASGCCSPALIKAMWVFWDQAVRQIGQTLHILLWVTMDNEHAAIICKEPDAGQLQVSFKRPFAKVAIHLPDYVNPSSLSLNLPYSYQERTLYLGPVQAGDSLVMDYFLRKCVQAEYISNSEYEVTWKGGRVVGIVPSPEGYPAYWWRQSTHR